MSLYAFLNMVMLIACGAAVGVLYWVIRYRKRMTYSEMAVFPQRMVILWFQLAKIILVGMAIMLLLAVFITPVN